MTLKELHRTWDADVPRWLGSIDGEDFADSLYHGEVTRAEVDEILGCFGLEPTTANARRLGRMVSRDFEGSL